MEGSIARALLNERRAVEAEEKSPIFKNVVYAEDELMITIDESLKVIYEIVCVTVGPFFYASCQLDTAHFTR